MLEVGDLVKYYNDNAYFGVVVQIVRGHNTRSPFYQVRWFNPNIVATYAQSELKKAE